MLSMRALVLAMFATVARRFAAASPSPENPLTNPSTSCAAPARLTDITESSRTMRLISPSLCTAMREKAPVMSRTLPVISFKFTAAETRDEFSSGLLTTELMPFIISCACSISTDIFASIASIFSSGVPATRSPSSRYMPVSRAGRMLTYFSPRKPLALTVIFEAWGMRMSSLTNIVTRTCIPSVSTFSTLPAGTPAKRTSADGFSPMTSGNVA